ncbi:2,3,4,5-tetrahydropyridine-2,6-dicarboxylate N-succinyltransferase [Microbulbifer spongiae]|uniref:2,3,4,5-tetrahydropyridine-2,6-dicarboxylate N-succinyltransferase n=1 Tax=Microbulbifer spongiae TaxID=2944933 RepID=A0ABY9EFD4_9GAMM|nr:2,3,4,5-tetrahydropyridine-2,6-dicarboxylate N-succinyltransferase [Microbulbifer sp. MI-G]WKD51205.1 2,3,4,5-tetrahydropyridine-2,6-dicarboxylate N-succinyltransferase [Microbulbifer sp. MI-G]
MKDNTYSIGFGIGTCNSKGDWLEVFYPKPLFKPSTAVAAAVKETLHIDGGNHSLPLSATHLPILADTLLRAGADEQAEILQRFATTGRPLTVVVLCSDAPPQSVPEAYLKLHLLSHRLVKPHETNLEGIFSRLVNVAWTNQGAIDLTELPQRQLEARLKGEFLTVSCVDKFPKMTDYVVPAGIRIAHTARVRLGAYLGEGTTIMHEGFVNFNAGTQGPNMIEGRISAGVFVHQGSDLGGGSSTMGTLSGGGNIVISVGENCLLGANAGIGIPLGDRCTVEAGLYITAGTKVALMDDSGQLVEHIKARALAGKSDLLFRRNSTNGAVECLTNKSAVELNTVLHSN